MKSSKYQISYSNGKQGIFYNTKTGEIFIDGDGFLVENSIDEFSEIIKKHNRVINSNHIAKFRILPTTFCNAACPYCFENGIGRKIMRKDAAQKTAASILLIANKCNRLEIEWFGGEPLLEFEIIKFINNEIKMGLSPKTRFTASLVTNGLLITNEMVSDFKDLNITNVQISLDGIEKDYDEGKGLPFGAFQKIKENLRLLTAQVKVDIRINFYPNELEKVEKLCEFFQAEKLENINFYAAKIYDLNKDLNHDEGVASVLSLLHKYGLKMNVDLLPQTMSTGCMAFYKNFFTIDPDGKMYKCDKRFDGLDVHTETMENLPKKCENCKVFPLCFGGCVYERQQGKNSCASSEETVVEILKMILEDYENVSSN
jgi:uncharacterized protein